jgi:hypothetical protein
VAHVFGVQLPVPQVFGAEAPQLCPVGHAPQSICVPQPSGNLPQLAPSSLQVLGLQPSAVASATTSFPASAGGP